MNHKNPSPFFSIVIPTLNEEIFLPKLLNDLTKQTFDMKLVEIIHVDGESIDKTVVKATNYQNKLKLRSCVVGRRNVAFQRNFGAQQATGKWVIFIDADDRLPKHFLEGIHYQIVKNPKLDVFTTLVAPEKNTTAYLTISKAFNLLILTQNKIGITFALGGMLGMKHQLAEKFKFKENLALAEDHNLVKTIVDSGYKFEVLTDPQFILNLRRQRKDGIVKSTLIQANILLNSIFKEELTKDYGYVMLGGHHYVVKNKEQFIEKLTKTINQFTSKQKIKIKELINSVYPLD